MKVILAKPRGFCAGVVRAIEIVERALDKYGPPVYVRHEIVHNKWVVDALKARGARFVEELSEVPPNAITIFSAHGVAKKVEAEAAERGLRVLNATCPLVSKVHAQGGLRYVGDRRVLGEREGLDIFLCLHKQDRPGNLADGSFHLRVAGMTDQDHRTSLTQIVAALSVDLRH